MAILDEWNATYALNPDVMTQAGESFKRRFYAEIAIKTLIDLEWSSDAEDLTQERESRRHVELDNAEYRRVLEEGVKLLRRTWTSSGDFAHYAQMWVLGAEAVLNAD
jgi:hypothetical protein